MKKYFGILFFLFTGGILAQSLTASVSDNPVGLQDRFQITFTFSGTDINNIKNFSAPAFNNFLTLSGPNQSTSIQFINGAQSASISFSYYLQPRSIGKFTIGSASIDYKGTQYKSDPITIEVVKGSSQPQQQAQNQQQQDNVATNKEIGDNLFIRAVADKQKVYLGEQVVVTYKLYTRVNIAAQMSISKLPQYQGFWAEELETSPTIMFTTEVVNGKQYRVGVLKKAALFPSQTGELKVSPFELNVPVQIRKKRKSNGNFFDDFFNDPFFDTGQTVNYTAKSNTIKLNVLPLPSTNVPPSFNGAVGKYSMTSSLDKSETKTNDPVTIKLDISGTGNIKLLNIPEVKLPTGMEKYDPQVKQDITRKDVVSGKMDIEYLIVPRIAGTKSIPPIEFSYFDPQKKSYETLSSPEYKIKIDQGNTVASYTSSGKEDIKVLDNDIRFIKTSDEALEKKNTFLIYSFGFWSAAIFPLFVLVGLITWKKKTDKLAGNLQLLKFQKAQKVARNRLKLAQKLKEENKQTEFYSEISQALFGYLEDKFKIAKSDFTVDKAIDELRNNEIKDELINDFKVCAEKCEFIRFAPSKDGVNAMNDMYDESAKIIIELEKSFSDKKHV